MRVSGEAEGRAGTRARLLLRRAAQLGLLAAVVQFAVPSAASALNNGESDISGSQIIFRDIHPGGGADLWLYDLSNGHYTQITNAGNTDQATIAGQRAYFITQTGGPTDNLEAYNLSTHSSEGVVATASRLYALTSSGGRYAVFASNLNVASSAIYRVDGAAGGTPQRLSPVEGSSGDPPGFCADNPEISDSWVVWTATNAPGGVCSGPTIYAKNLDTGETETVPAHPWGGCCVALSGSTASWVEGTDSDRKIILYDLVTQARTEVSTSPLPDGVSDFRGDKLVYEAEDGDPRSTSFSDRHVPWVYDLSSHTSKRVTDAVDDQQPSYGGRISGDWVVYQSGFHFEIFAKNIVTGEVRQIIPRPTSGAPRYVALGDSVAAGEGTKYGFHWVSSGSDGTWEQSGPVSPSWDTTYVPDACHQSADAYPRLVAADLAVPLTHLACTGAAGIDGILSSQTIDGNTVRPPQLGYGGPNSAAGYGPPNAAYDATDPDAVTISIGANDLDFVSIVASCLDPARSCALDSDLRVGLAAARSQQRAALRDILDEIARRASPGPPPAVFVTGYVDPFPADYPNGSCRDVKDVLGPFAGFSSGEVSFMRDQLKKLNDSIATEIATPTHASFAAFVPAPPAFSQHTFCSGDPWVYGPSLLPNAGLRGFLSVFAQHLGTDGWLDAAKVALKEAALNPAPFHPTPAGQRAIADQVEQRMHSVQRTPAGSAVPNTLPSGIQLRYSSVSATGRTSAITESEGAGIPKSPSVAKEFAFEVETSAAYSGPVTVRAPSAPGAQLFHYSGGAWQSVADSHYDNGYVIGTVNSLSPFVVGTPAPLISASFSHSPATLAPAAIQFDGSDSTVSSGSISSYRWDFGDGSVGTGVDPAHTYESSGSYTVTLRVTSDGGAVDDSTQTIDIENDPPVVHLTGPTSGRVGDPLSFSAASSTDPNGSVAGWLWDFGDGSSPVTTNTAVHTYAVPRAYQVHLVALDNEGEGAEQVLTVDVAARPTGGGGSSGQSPGPGSSGQSPGPGSSGQSPGPGATGARKKALHKCKKKRRRARARCRKKARKLPI